MSPSYLVSKSCNGSLPDIINWLSYDSITATFCLPSFPVSEIFIWFSNLHDSCRNSLRTIITLTDTHCRHFTTSVKYHFLQSVYSSDIDTLLQRNLSAYTFTFKKVCMCVCVCVWERVRTPLCINICLGVFLSTQSLTPVTTSSTSGYRCTSILIGWHFVFCSSRDALQRRMITWSAGTHYLPGLSPRYTSSRRHQKAPGVQNTLLLSENTRWDQSRHHVIASSSYQVRGQRHFLSYIFQWHTLCRQLFPFLQRRL